MSEFTGPQQTEIGYAMHLLDRGATQESVKARLEKRQHEGKVSGLAAATIIKHAARNIAATRLLQVGTDTSPICYACPWRILKGEVIGVRVLIGGNDADGNVIHASIVVNARGDTTREQVVQAALKQWQSGRAKRPSRALFATEVTGEVYSLFKGGLQGAKGAVIE